MSWGITAFLGFWVCYSLLTCYSIVTFPAYEKREKFSQIALALLVPIVGAYIANTKLGMKFDQSAVAETGWQLPMWSSFTFRSNGSSNGDDGFDIDL